MNHPQLVQRVRALTSFFTILSKPWARLTEGLKELVLVSLAEPKPHSRQSRERRVDDAAEHAGWFEDCEPDEDEDEEQHQQHHTRDQGSDEVRLGHSQHADRCLPDFGFYGRDHSFELSVVDFVASILIRLSEELEQFLLRKEESHVLGELTEFAEADWPTLVFVELRE